MRGGGAGSWGVIISATFQTFPTFDAAVSVITITTNTTDQMAEIGKVHGQHIFDLDSLRAGQYFHLSVLGASVVSSAPSTGAPTMILDTFFPYSSLAQAEAALQPFIDDVQKVDGVTLTQQNVLQNINDALTLTDDLAGFNAVLGSRLVPATAYNNVTLVGQVYSELLNAGTLL